MGRMIRGWSIAARLFVLQVAFIAVLTTVATVWLFADSRSDVDADAATHSMTVAASVAANPFVTGAVASDDPSATLQPYAVDLMRATNTDFITIMTPDRTRLTHPDPAEIGRPFLGTVTPALAGESFTETYAGTLGPSVRAVVPIENAGGDVVAIVAAGVTVDNISAALGGRLAIVFATAVLTLVLGAVAAWLLSRYLRRVTWGRGPEEMSRMFAYYEGVLHSVREGLVLVDAQGRLLLYNDQAAEFLGLPFERPTEPVPVRDLDLPGDLGALLASGERAVDEVYVTPTDVLVVNQEVTVSSGPARILGTVTTLRDHTDLQKLTGELQTMRTLSDALRSQTHEFSNRLHTIVALIELGRAQEAVDFAANELDVGQELADSLLASGEEPVLTALLLGKSAQARERGIDLDLRIDERLGRLGLEPSELVTIVGNLVDNAMDAVKPELDRAETAADADADAGAAAGTAAGAAVPTERPRVLVEIDRNARDLVLRVSDNGSGFADVDLAFSRGYSTKRADVHGRGIGLALVDQAVRRLGGAVDVHNAPGAVVTVRLPLELAEAS
ncbi:ATP-binding protein [Conyzicola sp.]|uniref:sensor histidine kinase n=1 Tax=Conyzicola sp. TaxID=1969404 RepID=UPI003989E905